MHNKKTNGRRNDRAPARRKSSPLPAVVVAVAVVIGGGVIYAVTRDGGDAEKAPLSKAGKTDSRESAAPRGQAEDNKPSAPAKERVAEQIVDGNSMRGNARAADLVPPESTFGPHIRDVVLANNGSLAVLSTMNWDQNLYGLDTSDGSTRWRKRVGQYFTFSPKRIETGVAVQGFDFESAEGYHLYLAGKDGRLERRFALYGLPRRLPHRFVPGIIKDRINSFAVPSDGSWVASAGDLGLAVWQRNGDLLWSQDWWKTKRRAATLAVLDSKTLLVIEGMKVAAHSARDGKVVWELDLAPTGEVTGTAVSTDGRTLALLTTSDGGKVCVLRGGKLARALITTSTDVALNADGSLLAVTDANQLKLYSLDEGLQWSFAGDDRLRFPRFSNDDRRIAVASDLGSVYVLDPNGRVLHEKDLMARTVPVWMPDGDLLLSNWMGTVCRLDSTYAEKWRTVLAPDTESMTGKLLADDGAPTTRISSWSNAEKRPEPIEPNLLAGMQLLTKFVPSGDWGGRAHLAHDPKSLYDGSDRPPESPWVAWNYVGFFAETSPVNYLLIDTFRTRLRVTGVTLFEDATHPESWLRDAQFEYWDAAAEEWIPVQTLLSDDAVHTHRFEKPVEAARFRILFPWGVVGSFRLGEIVFHGERLGCSHPDVAARRPVAVLFDEHDDIKTCMMHSNNGLSFKLDGTFAGGRCLAIRGDASAGPVWQPPFGHVIPNWDFEIAEQPRPGQYRFLSFAWRGASERTRGVSLQLRGPDGGVKLCAGEARRFSDTDPEATKLSESPPREWQVQTVDLWELTKKPFRIQSMSVGASGDGAMIDAIKLGRSEGDLREATP